MREDGIASFDRIRHWHHDATVFLYAFDLIELDGEDLRREPLEVRKVTLASMIGRAGEGTRFHATAQHDPAILGGQPGARHLDFHLAEASQQ